MKNNDNSPSVSVWQRKKTYAIIVAVFIFAVCAFTVCLNLQFFNESPFKGIYVWEAPSYGAYHNGNKIVIDSSKTKVSILNETNSVTSVIHGGDSSGKSFYYAEHVVMSADAVYVVDVLYASGGSRVERERIFQYDYNGSLKGVLFEKIYLPDEMPGQYGNILYLGEYGDDVCFLVKEGDTLHLYNISDKTESPVRTVYTVGIPPIWNATYSYATDEIWITTKTGEVYTAFSGQSDFERYNTDLLDEEGTVVCDIAASDGSVYITDLGLRRIISITDGRVLIQPKGNLLDSPIYYRLSASRDIVATTDNENILFINKNGENVFYGNTGRYSADYFFFKLAAWAAGAVIFACIPLIIFFCMLRLLSGKSSGTLRVSVLLAVVISICTIITSAGIISITFGRISSKISGELERTVTVISKLSGKTFGDSLERINSLSDYGGEDFKAVRTYLDIFCDTAYGSSSNLYYVVYKFKDNLMYGVADYEDTTGTIYPYCVYEGSGYDEVVETGEIVVVAEASDAYGSWSYAIAPIYNSNGEAIAVLEMGTDLYNLKNQNSKLIQELAVSTFVMILIILLLLTEGTVLAEGMKNKIVSAESKSLFRSMSFEITSFLRPMIFLSFFASNLSAAFMPILSAKLLTVSSLNISESLGAALPMSAEMFFIALFAFVGGFLIDKRGLRKVFLISVIVQIAGYLFTAFAVYINSYELLLLGRIFTGSGMGVTVVAFNAMPSMTNDEKKREKLFSHLSAGIISGVVVGASLGSYIADLTDYSYTFAASAVAMIPVFLLAYMSLTKNNSSIHAASEWHGLKAIFSFTSDKQVFTFLIFIMVPFLILLYFKDFLFPIYSSQSGLSEITIGNIFLFSGVISIYLGPPITQWLLDHTGQKGTITLASAMFAVSMIVFGLYPTVETSVAAVFVMSLAAGLGLSGQGVYFSSLSAFEKYGANRSMSVYSLWDNVSQTIGPLIFGALSVFYGYGRSSLYIGLAALVLLALFVIVNKKGR